MRWGFTAGRVLIVSLLLLASVAGTVNFVLRRQVSFDIGQSGTRILVENLHPRGSAEQLGIRPGDMIRQIRGREVSNLPQANWEFQWARPGESIPLVLQRGDSTYKIAVPADEPPPWAFLILDRISGLAFLILGLLVWWRESRDSTVTAFMRVNILTGLGVLMLDPASIYRPQVIQEAYAVAYLIAHCLVPAALTDFLFRFTRRADAPPYSSTAWIGIYAPCAATAIFLSAYYLNTFSTGNPVWMEQYATLHRYGYGILLIAAVLASTGRLLYVYFKPRNAWEKNRNRWLLICLFVGIAPYAFLDKLPSVWGMKPLLPSGVAMALLVIAPIGWGMAVASFKMLKVEWTLSRTVVYTTTAGILVYFALTIILVGGGYSARKDVFSLVVLIVTAVILLLLAGSALIDRVKWTVDRIYYGDWFNTEHAVQKLSRELSATLLERDIVRILTEELPDILKIERSGLIIRGPEERWIVPAQPQSLSLVNIENDGVAFTGRNADDGLPQEGIRSLTPSDSLASEGFRLAIPLIHGGEIMGWLLLGGKESGAPFSERDHHLLNTLSGVAGLSLANIELSRKIMEHERRSVVVDLAGGIAHEINNALYPLMGQAQWMDFTLASSLDAQASEKMSQPVKIIVDMCGRIKRIAENLNRLSAPVQIQKTPLCLNNVADDAVQLLTETAGRIKRYQQNAPGATLVLKKDLDATIPSILGDHAQLSQVFMNLLINAADAIESQGAGTLTIGTRRVSDPNGVAGFVEDTGPGIPHELLDKVFQPYFTTKPKGKGTGLGLAMVRSIVEAHGGRVSVFSQEGHGTRIEFILPSAELKQ